MSDDGILFKGIVLMALLSITVGLLAVAATPKAGPDDRYTAMYMNTGAIDRNITKNNTSLAIPFSVENHENGRADYHYSVSVFYKDTVFHPGTDAWSEDMGVDEAHDVANGSFSLDDGKTRMIAVKVPVQSARKWRYANVTIDLYKNDTPGVYRSLRLWAVNQVL